jgi:hypothetical protein
MMLTTSWNSCLLPQKHTISNCHNQTLSLVTVILNLGKKKFKEISIKMVNPKF